MMNSNESNANNEAQNTLPPPITPDLNAPIFFIEDKSGQNNEIRNARKKLTGDMDLISHFGLYYLYEISKNKPINNDSDYQSYIEDIPIKQIIKDTTIKDLIMAPQTQRIPLLPFDQDTLDNAFTLRPGSFPEDSNLDTSYFSNHKKRQQIEEDKQENGDTHTNNTNNDTNDSKIPKVTLKISNNQVRNEYMTYNDYDKPKKKRSYTADPEENERSKKKHKKKKSKIDEYPPN